MKAVPGLVDEIEFTADETGIDREFLTFVLNEWDDQALEEAMLIKDTTGAEVVVVGLAEDPDIEQILYTALAKGADSAVTLGGTGRPGKSPDTHARAAAFAEFLRAEPADLVLTGVQAADDLDGQLAPMLAAHLGLVHISVVVGVEPGADGVTLRQEFAGGRSHELVVQTPAVIGLQASRQAPRYASITRIRQAMQAGGLRQVAVAAPGGATGLSVRRMYHPQRSGHAEMLAGSADEVAGQIVALLRERGLVKG
jgi:electron transfer flavoprotein beta subunit